MTTTIAILSIVIIVLCGALIWMYFFGNAKIKPSDIVDLVDYKIKLNQLTQHSGKCTYGGYHSESEWKDIRHREQLSDQFKKMIELEREITELKKELSWKEEIVKTQRDKIDSLQKEIDFIQSTGNRKEGESIGVPYSKERLRQIIFGIPEPPEDRVVNQAKKPVPPKPRNEASPYKKDEDIKTDTTMPNSPRKTVITTEDKPTTSTKGR